MNGEIAPGVKQRGDWMVVDRALYDVQVEQPTPLGEALRRLSKTRGGVMLNDERANLYLGSCQSSQQYRALVTPENWIVTQATRPMPSSTGSPLIGVLADDYLDVRQPEWAEVEQSGDIRFSGGQVYIDTAHRAVLVALVRGCPEQYEFHRGQFRHLNLGAKR